MSKSLLQIQDGIKTFRNDTILSNIQLDVQPGEFICILGPSGSGKTTLLRLLAGLDQWSEGTFEADKKAAPAFVFQEANLLNWRTVIENILLPLELCSRKNSPTQNHLVGINALKKVHMENSAQLYPRELSGGMKMRASIARALVTGPNLLFLDEPFAALDEPTREELQEQLRSLWETQPTTIIFVTHSIQEAAFLANRIIFLSGRPASIMKDFVLELPKQRSKNTRDSSEYFKEIKIIRNLFETSSQSQVPT
jgi:NitT/TauT family transport system ATP-binding protein